jgi:hypothetical protein
MASDIKTYLVGALMQLQGHLNAGPGSDPNTEAMVNALLETEYVYNKDAADGAASTATADTYMLKAGVKMQLIDAAIISAGTLTAHADNYATITVEKADGAAGAQTTMAEVTTEVTGSGDWAAATLVPITLSTTLANLQVAAGGVVNFKIAKAGTGVAVPISAIVLRFRMLDA